MKVQPSRVSRFSLSLLFPILVAGCAAKSPAPTAKSADESATAPVQTITATARRDARPKAERERAPLLKPDYPEKYVVKKGDTLWDISSRFLKDPWRWPVLWHKNPQIENPHLIYPGDILTLIYVDGKPTLQVQRGRPTIRLSPKVREEELVRPVPTIPIEAIRQFLQRPRIVGEKELQRAPYVVAAANGHLAAATGNHIYARGLSGNDITEFVLLRRGQTYRDPDDGEVLGYEAIHVADAQIKRFGDPAKLFIDRSSREVLKGDRLLPAVAERFREHFTPRAPAKRVEGRIIAVMDGVSQIGQYQVVVLNLGRRDSIERGHVLAVYQKGERVLDDIRNERIRLPDERAGNLMVFRTFENISYALVMEARTAMHVLNSVRNP